jgi:hypothetical protein
MEPVVATGGKRWQMPRARTGRKQAKTVAGGCDRLPRAAHGKGRVDATSWGAETRSSCRGELVLVDEAAEQVAAAYVKSVRRRLRSDG